jgi:hypothetical protein
MPQDPIDISNRESWGVQKATVITLICLAFVIDIFIVIMLYQASHARKTAQWQMAFVLPMLLGFAMSIFAVVGPLLIKPVPKKIFAISVIPLALLICLFYVL